jgi:hypothetical protein
MADTLTTITKPINSPPGQLAAGGVLVAIVYWAAVIVSRIVG